MWAEPDDLETADRMRAAHRRAQDALGVLPGAGAREVWGWRGRTLSGPVTASDGQAWLRLACIPAGQTDTTFWDGSLEAEKAIPRSVPRPRLRDTHDWYWEQWRYRAELYDYVAARPVATSPMARAAPDLPPSWWAAVRGVLGDIAAVATGRFTVRQEYLDRAMPRFLGTPIETTAPSWSTAHGDFHYANLCAPILTVLDWEGWGLAPTGYDAAMFHSYSLLVPRAAGRVRSELAHTLDNPAGRFAELVVIAELLHSITRGDNLQLAELLRARAALLLGRPVPLSPGSSCSLGRYSSGSSK